LTGLKQNILVKLKNFRYSPFIITVQLYL
jgi:hypothetical protein